MASAVWEIVGGADKGGILVRVARDTKSAESAKRLGFGALVQQLGLQGERLHYYLLDGDGPETGWVSLKLKDKELVARRNDLAPSVTPPNSASREQRNNTRSMLLMQMEGMPYLKQQFQGQIDILDQEDAEELIEFLRASAPRAVPAKSTGGHVPARSAPKPSPALAQRPVPSQSSTTQRPAPAAAVPPVAVPNANAFLAALGEEEVEEVEDEVEDVEDEVVELPRQNLGVVAATCSSADPGNSSNADPELEVTTPSIDEVLAGLDRDVEEQEPEDAPSIEEILATLDKDAQEEEEFEEAIRARDAFFDLSNTAGTAIAKMASNPLAELTADNVSLPNKFSMSNIHAFGSMCLEQIRKERGESGVNNSGKPSS